MRVLIVGCGYVGMALGKELTAHGHEVFGLRRTERGAAELESAGIQGVLGDITRGEDLARLDAEYDWVVNCVSASGGGVEDYRAVYLRGARNLVAWLEARPPKKFVYTSSTGVYGQTDGLLVDETSPAEPQTETGRVLVEAEEVLLEAARRMKLPAVILRLAGIYGPGRGYWLRENLRGQARIEGTGQRLINSIHRDDAAGAILAALHRGRPGEVYNVVDDEPVSQIEFFEWLSTVLAGTLPPAVPEDLQAAGQRGLSHKRVSNLKLKAELGYRFKFPTFREGYGVEIRRLDSKQPV